jgi:hypothetical protein
VNCEWPAIATAPAGMELWVVCSAYRDICLKSKAAA